MKDKRSESNFYELQVGSGSLSYKLYDGIVCESIKKAIFEDKENVELVGEIVKSSTKTLNNDMNFEHIIKHFLSCTLDKDGNHVRSCDVFRFGMLHKVFGVEYMRCIGQGKKGFEQGIKDFHKNARPCLERGKAWYEGYSNKAIREEQNMECSFEQI